MADRMPKVDELLRQQVAQIISSEIEFSPGTLVTVTKALTAVDLSCAKIFISVLPEAQERQVKKNLQKELYNIKKLLNKRIILRKIPKLIFIIDETEKKAAQIDKLLDNLT
jgi:ribosome-binding factor A